MDKLPVEILYRIFDHLDIETLFFSIRSVCRYFQSTVHNYDRLDFHFKIISKCHFDVLCRLISPENIRSLTLYKTSQIPSQISLFLSRVHLQHLTRLHSIYLDEIEEFQFNHLFEQIALDHLRSISIFVNRFNDETRKRTAKIFSTIVQQSNLRTIELGIPIFQLPEIEWPSNCSIRCLILNRNIDYENLVRIYSCSPQLHRLIVKQQFSYLITSHQLACSFPQLTSLIIKQVNVTIDRIEAFLSLTPSLIYLKLIGGRWISDGKRWEDFIEANLRHLNRFEFDVTPWKPSTGSRQDLDLVVESYRSAFWIEHKKWFVTAELDPGNRHCYRMYSLPMCHSSYKYDLNLRKVSLPTSNGIYSMGNISRLYLLYSSVSNGNISWLMNFSFPNLRKLHLYFSGTLPVDYQNYLQELVDVSQLIEMKIQHFDFHQCDEDFLAKLLAILQKSSKLSSLILDIDYYQYKYYSQLDTVIESLPRQVYHLQIPITSSKHIEKILERCQLLSVLRFPSIRTEHSLEMEQWFERNTFDSIYEQSAVFDIIWIGKKKNDDKEENFKCKRIKISGDFNES